MISPVGQHRDALEIGSRVIYMSPEEGPVEAHVIDPGHDTVLISYHPAREPGDAHSVEAKRRVGRSDLRILRGY